MILISTARCLYLLGTFCIERVPVLRYQRAGALPGLVHRLASNGDGCIPSQMDAMSADGSTAPPVDPNSPEAQLVDACRNPRTWV